MKALATPTLAQVMPLFLFCAALQAQTPSRTAPASQPASTAPASTLAATTSPTLPVPDPQPSGPLDIPLPLWVLLGVCGVGGAAGLTVSWQQKRKRQRRQISLDSMM